MLSHPIYWDRMWTNSQETGTSWPPPWRVPSVDKRLARVRIPRWRRAAPWRGGHIWARPLSSGPPPRVTTKRALKHKEETKSAGWKRVSETSGAVRQTSFTLLNEHIRLVNNRFIRISERLLEQLCEKTRMPLALSFTSTRAEMTASGPTAYNSPRAQARCFMASGILLTGAQRQMSARANITLDLSLMDPFPSTEILAPVSSCRRLMVLPWGPKIFPTKLNWPEHKIREKLISSRSQSDAAGRRCRAPRAAAVWV